MKEDNKKVDLLESGLSSAFRERTAATVGPDFTHSVMSRIRSGAAANSEKSLVESIVWQAAWAAFAAAVILITISFSRITSTTNEVGTLAFDPVDRMVAQQFDL